MADTDTTTEDLEVIANFLAQHYEQSIIQIFLNYCQEEQYELANIEEDIEDEKDSMIYEHMQSECNWNDQETHQFIQNIGQYFHSDTPNISQSNSVDQTDDHKSNPLPPDDLNHDTNNTHNPSHIHQEQQEEKATSSSTISSELQSILDSLSNRYHYNPQIIQIFRDYCIEQEYLDHANILEDIETEDDSFIIEHMQTECNWNKSQCDSFITKLNQIISGNNQTDQNKHSIPIPQKYNNAHSFTSSPQMSNHPALAFNFPPLPKPQDSPHLIPYRLLNILFMKMQFAQTLQKARLNKQNMMHSQQTSPVWHNNYKMNQNKQPFSAIPKHGNNDKKHTYHNPMKQAMNQHNYSMKSSQNGYVIQSKSKQQPKPSPSPKVVTEQKHSSPSKSESSQKRKKKKNEEEDIYAIHDNENEANYYFEQPDYTEIDLVTRARVSLRRKMKRERRMKNGALHKNKEKKSKKVPTTPFINDIPDDFDDDSDDDDWNSVNDSWKPSHDDYMIDNSFGNRNVDDMVGLRNIGATCYMNSILQALNCSDMYKDYLLNMVTELKFHPKNAKKYRLPDQKMHDVQKQWEKQQKAVVELKNLLRNLDSKQKGVADSRSFVSALPKRWRPGKQQDSNEFAKFVLNFVWETIDQSAIMKTIYDRTRFHSTEKYQLKHLRLDPYSHGMLNYTTKCLNCNGKSAKFEAFFDLSLALANHSKSSIKTQKLIEDHMKPECLSRDNAYFCGKCNKNVTAMRFISIVRPPKLLLICFKRYELDFKTSMRKKIMTDVDCPLLLPIDRDIQDKQNNEVVPYVLYAVVVHHGQNAQFGHYYTIARKSNDALRCYMNHKLSKTNVVDHGGCDDGKDIENSQSEKYNGLDGGDWYKFDDSLVTRSSYQHLQRLSDKDTPYMLFYLRVDDGDM